MRKDYQKPISHHQFCLLLSLAKSRDLVLLLNGDLEDIKLSKSALEEMVQMSKELLFTWQHPLIELNGVNMCLFKVRMFSVTRSTQLMPAYFV